jgi:hypothetical protein
VRTTSRPWHLGAIDACLSSHVQYANMRIPSPEVADHPRPVLMSDGNPRLVSALRDALDRLKPRHTLLV